MKRRVVPLIAAVLLVGGNTLFALDSVRRVGGAAVSGTVQAATKNEVRIDKTVGGSETIPINEVEAIFYDGEPPNLRLVRTAVANGAFANALATLDKIDPATATKPEHKSEMQFYRAYCLARLALGGGAKVDEAGKLMFDFVSQNPDSYHTYMANEALGDLFVASGKFDDARRYYGVLEQSSFPEFKMRANVAIGRALLTQGKPADAQAAFDAALAAAQGVNSPGAETQRFAATLGKAACQAEQGQADEGIKSVETVIQGLNPEAADLNAQAYVTLGRCYEKKGEKKAALLAYLHVDTLFFSHPQSHVEALRRLAALWNEFGKPERAVQAAQTLKDRYGSQAAATN